MSESIDMYLVSIARIAETIQDETVPIPALAERLEIQPVSTNQMIRRLEEGGLVRYLPYKGVQLTDEGREIAEQVRRQHQLWEAFLVDCLDFTLPTADALACRFEHIMSDEEVEHLAAFMQAPIRSWLSKAASEEITVQRPEIPLAQLAVAQSGQVTRLSADPASAGFLSAAGVRPEIILTTLARTDSGEMLVGVNEKKRIHLAPELTTQIWLEKVEN